MGRDVIRVLDLFSGRRGWSEPFAQAGHEVWTLDNDPRFGADMVIDIRDLNVHDLPWIPDVVLASPPCTSFSVASIGKHWTGGRRAYVPKTDEAVMSKQLVQATVHHIQTLWALGLDRWWVENPRGVLRNLGLIPETWQRSTVWWCHYGENRAKPTDLWGSFGGWQPEPVCHNRRPGHPEGCCCQDHEAAPRGAKTGTQGVMGADLRAEIPWGLAESVRRALEVEMVDMTV